MVRRALARAPRLARRHFTFHPVADAFMLLSRLGGGYHPGGCRATAYSHMLMRRHWREYRGRQPESVRHALLISF
jgi:hypothetical protein